MQIFTIKDDKINEEIDRFLKAMLAIIITNAALRLCHWQLFAR